MKTDTTVLEMKRQRLEVLDARIATWREMIVELTDQVREQVEERERLLRHVRDLEAAAPTVKPHCTVVFSPEAIREHYEDQLSKQAEWVDKANDTELWEVAEVAINSPALWLAYGEVLDSAVAAQF